jgi:hypothetical protein
VSMPLARIRTFDPEAIAFLAAQLAQNGYTLQFVRPDETGLEEADLELTVVRRDLQEALRLAGAEAERLGVDVVVVSGAVPVIAAASNTEPEPGVRLEAISPGAIAVSEPVLTPAPVIPAQAEPVAQDAVRWTPPPEEIYQWPQPRQAQRSASGLVVPKERIAQAARESAERAADQIGRGVGYGMGALAVLTASTAERFRGWKDRILARRELRRKSRQHEKRAAVLRFPQKPVRRPQPPWLRDRIYKGAVVAAVLVAAALIGWQFAGSAGPANPVNNASLVRSATVRQQFPFGPASINPPANSAAPTRVAPSSSRHSKPKPAASRRGRHVASRRSRHTRSVTAEDDEPEVVVRRFAQKPVSEEAKAKTKDGVKVISEE